MERAREVDKISEARSRGLCGEPGRKILHPKAQGDEGCQKPTVSLDKDMGQ